MGNIHPDITPRGFNQKDIVKFFYAAVASLKGLCSKLDDDSAVNDTDYEANCYTAMIEHVIEDHLGNRTGLTGNWIITPTGIMDNAAILELMYDLTNAIETLTEQLDSDSGVADTDYEANCYTALFLHMVEDSKGNILGNGNTYYFRPGGLFNNSEFVDWIANYVNAWETLCEQLDSDGTVNDTNYEALWYTATFLFRVEHSNGNVYGNTRTDM